MKLRAFLLMAILIGGSYTVYQDFQSYREKAFVEILSSMSPPFKSMTYAKPASSLSNAETWEIDDEKEIEELVQFLELYHIKKMKPEEIDRYDDVLNYGIQLEDELGNRITVIIDEDLIIQNNLLYYKIVDGPLDVDWLVHFFLGRQL